MHFCTFALFSLHFSQEAIVLKGRRLASGVSGHPLCGHARKHTYTQLAATGVDHAGLAGIAKPAWSSQHGQASMVGLWAAGLATSSRPTWASTCLAASVRAHA
eukprot:364429-Chlamydomonas_euryale.AAC.26